MKRSILIFLFCALFGISSAQLKVADTGKVGILMDFHLIPHIDSLVFNYIN